MNTNHKSKQHQQKQITHYAQTTDSYSFFNLLTSPKLLSMVEEQLPEHRERAYPPTTTLLTIFRLAVSKQGHIVKLDNACL